MHASSNLVANFARIQSFEPALRNLADAILDFDGRLILWGDKRVVPHSCGDLLPLQSSEDELARGLWVLKSAALHHELSAILCQ